MLNMLTCRKQTNVGKNEIMKIQLPDKVNDIIYTIEQAGYDAYAVGGCVRDSILGREPEDWDITTSAKPEEIKRLFKRTIDTGIQHGTVTVMIEKEGFEVTTYRIDGEYEDSRHPREVTFTPSLKEDLQRRDFTINAMAYNSDAGLVDIFHGMEDLRRKLIKCVGDPRKRFEEDALRMMRAVRFSAQLGYDIDENTRQAIREMAPSLSRISAERIQAELVKLLVSPHPDYLRTAYETGITKVILPQFDLMMETEQNNPHHCLTVGEHTLKAMQQVRPDKVLRLAMLFHDMEKPSVRTQDDEGIHHFYGHPQLGEKLAVQLMRELRFDNDTIQKVACLVRCHDNDIEPTPRGVRRAMHAAGPEMFPYLLDVKQADLNAQSMYNREEKQEKLNLVRETYARVLEEEACLSLRDLAVDGRDLIKEGIRPGKQIGEILSRLLQLVIDHPEYNTREYLLSQVRENIR